MVAARVVAGFLGLVLAGLGAWIVALPLLLYAFYPALKAAKKGTGVGLHGAALAACLMLALSAIAFLSGGTLSPVIFLTAGLSLLILPRFPAFSWDWRPVDGTILLRSRWLPFRWAVVAELKAGSEDPGRLLSSFTGRLVVRGATGSVFAVSTFTAFGRGSAQEAGLRAMRLWTVPLPPAPLFLPLDAKGASKSFRKRVAESPPPRRLVGGRPDLEVRPDILVVESVKGRVVSLSGYLLEGDAPRVSIPTAKHAQTNEPQLWELLRPASRGPPLGSSDHYSTFLESVDSTRGLALGNRLEGLQGEGPTLRVRALTGEEVELSRDQFRAIISMYA